MFKLKIFLRSLLGERIWGIVQGLSPLPRHRLAWLCRRETGMVVRSGPFAGMRYLPDAVSGGFVPKTLGIYEQELHRVIRSLGQLEIVRTVNIGASDGYYAVGLARVLPGGQVLAFELSARGQQAIRCLAEKNGVANRVQARGRCDLEQLQAALTPPANTLVLCDVEGFEDVLMDPDTIPALRHAWLLVEIHDGKNPGVSERVRHRFVGTHHIETIWQQKRTAADFPFLNRYTRSLSPEHLEATVNEGRPVREGVTPMSWYWMVPKSS